jgi:hypothetical protein
MTLVVKEGAMSCAAQVIAASLYARLLAFAERDPRRTAHVARCVSRCVRRIWVSSPPAWAIIPPGSPTRCGRAPSSPTSAGRI